MTKTTKRIILGFSIAATVVAAVYYSRSLEIVQRNEWIAYDYFLSLKRQELPAPEKIQIILIDESSLQLMDSLVGRWPWPRTVLADVIDYLSMGEPEAIIFDLLFVERERSLSTGAEKNDQRLIDATRSAGNVIHAMQFFHDSPDETSSQLLNKPLPGEIVRQNALTLVKQSASHENARLNNGASSLDTTDQKNTDSQFNNYLVPIDGLYQAARALGVVSVNKDADGVLRRTPLTLSYQSAEYPALSVAPLITRVSDKQESQAGTFTSRSASQSEQANIRINGGSLSINNTAVSLDENGKYLVNYYPRFNTFSMSGILTSITALKAGDVEKIMIDPGVFKDSYIFIGANAIGLHDLKDTPLSRNKPGVYMHASVLANVLNDDMLKPADVFITWFNVVKLSLLTALGVLFLRHTVSKVLWPVGLITVFMIWSYWQFSLNQVVIVVQPLLAIFLAWALAYVYMLFTEGREKAKVRNMFSRYVSPAALSVMVDQYDSYKNADVGSKETVSILFSDIRGFTTLSETLAPETVVDMLNYYFARMTEAIHKNEGTIDKFIGDAIMATWGAPIKSDNHATNAVHAALAMIESLDDVNQWLAQRQLDPIDIGIGIHTGEVILGSIGSEQKADYTVIGDNVNLASRLEGVTKTYGCRLILSESTYQLITDIPCVMLDMIRVKGKNQPIKIYTPVSLFTAGMSTGNVDVSTVLGNVSQAFNAYLQQCWEDAIVQFKALPNRQLGQLYISRCEEFKQHPPPENWDGVFTMKNK